MNFWKCTGVVVSVLALASCGGGGDEPGDVDAMVIDPAGVNWQASSCSNGVFRARSLHTINGGKPPFRILNSFPQNFEFESVHVVNGIYQYVPLELSPTGVAQLNGKDPQFAVLTTARCSEISFVVLDLDSQRVTVEITVEEEEQEEDVAEDE